MIRLLPTSFYRNTLQACVWEFNTLVLIYSCRRSGTILLKRARKRDRKKQDDTIPVPVMCRVRGFHVYRSVWTLSCSRETRNLHDPFAVKVLKTEEIVSHLQKRISFLCSSSVSESKRTDSEPSLAAI